MKLWNCMKGRSHQNQTVYEFVNLIFLLNAKIIWILFLSECILSISSFSFIFNIISRCIIRFCWFRSRGILALWVFFFLFFDVVASSTACLWIVDHFLLSKHSHKIFGKLLRLDLLFQRLCSYTHLRSSLGGIGFEILEGLRLRHLSF